MSDSGLKYPSWQIPLQEAMLEIDSKKSAKKIEKVEALISERLLEMAPHTDHGDERDAIAGAASILRRLKEDGS